MPSDQVLTVEQLPKTGDYLVYGSETDYWQVKAVTLAEGDYRSYDARIEATQVLPEDILPLPRHRVW
ncbi:hypothetical protein [Leptolyngbya sp. FACHB-261]|uniref:hypothetical protein n=1 Tax=Leptolyngbya sp. FACHB-261 TaxID=2692806 RepID=UPI001682B8CD|nr:hypothetical protein [Leptolyngbya sp. FACHB-261]